MKYCSAGIASNAVGEACNYSCLWQLTSAQLSSRTDPELGTSTGNSDATNRVAIAILKTRNRNWLVRTRCNCRPNVVHTPMQGKLTAPNTPATKAMAATLCEGEYTVTAVRAIVHALGFTHWNRTA